MTIMLASYELFSIHTLLLALAVSAMTRLLWRARQRRKIPLPPSPRGLPIVGHFHLLGPLLHQSFSGLSSKHGPLFHLRLGSVPCMVASTPELAREILKMNELKFAAREQTAAIHLLTYNAGFAFAPYDAYWKFIKKLSQTELLSPRTLGQFLPVRSQELHYFLGLIYDKCQFGESINLTRELLKLTNNIISQMMLSIRCSGTDSQADACQSVIREVTEIFGEFNMSDFIWFCKYIDFQGFRKRFEGIHRRYDSILENIMETREQSRKKKREGGTGQEEEINDFLDMMLDVLEDPNSEIQLTKNNIKALMMDFFTAGTDTTAIVLEWSLAELMNNPSVLEKAKQEIKNVVGSTRLVQESDTPNLPYIQAIIKETFRFHPPIPMVTRKAVEEAVINGYRIPAGSLLFINNWAIGRDPEVWERPMEFYPERFLGKTESEAMDVKGHNYELLPFGSGRRACPGISLAMLELPVTLAAMIQCFDWKPCSLGGEILQTVDMSERPGLTAPRANDLICLPVPRLDVCPIISTK
ncbi:licodione synthase-like [Punica granatum]|nr:licodione synthase-like [Punica granatum]